LAGEGQVMISYNAVSGASWEKSRRSKFLDKSYVFALADVEELLRFVVSNTFLKNGNEIRRQCIGVPMGTNSAPSLANLYLHSYESSWIQKKALEDFNVAHSMHLSFRLIDDLCSLDNALASSIFLRENEIYP